MYYLLAGALIACLIAVEGYCGFWLYEYFKKRSEERTAARRAFYRYKAYKIMNDKYDLKTSREKLWRSLQK